MLCRWIVLLSCSFLYAYHQKEDLSIEASIARFQAQAPVVLSDGNLAQKSPPEQSSKEAPGVTVYKKYCHTCHGNGIAGAPKVGNQLQWQERYDQGWPLIMQRALQGYKGMPAKGHCVKCTEQDIKDAIVYMMKESGINAQH